MPEDNDKDKGDSPAYSVGYKKPPRHTQFKHGQSGNPKGRPKKVDRLADLLWKWCLTMVTIADNGKRKRVSMLEAIVRQHLNKAASGDTKSAAIVFRLLELCGPEGGDNLTALLQEFRANHTRYMAAAEDEIKMAQTGDGGNHDE
jgi:hypothetical protein